MKEKFINDLMVIVSEYLNGSDLSNIRLRLEIAMKDYDVVLSEKAVIPWQGDENENVLKRFLAAKIAKGCSKRTIRYYQQSITTMLLRIGKRYSDITSDDIRLYLAERVYRDGVSKITVNNERRNLSSFFSWLQTEEILLKNPMSKVDALKEDKKKKESFSDFELEKMRGACRNNRERALIEIALSTWCRASEIVQIRKDDIRQDEIIVHGKGGKDRKVYLNAKAIYAVSQYLAERSDTNPYIFPRINRERDCGAFVGDRDPEWYKNADNVDPSEHMGRETANSLVKKVGKRAEVSNVHTHRFRRTGATSAVRNGMSMLLASKLLGHASIETTQIYLDISDAELKAAHGRFVG